MIRSNVPDTISLSESASLSPTAKPSAASSCLRSRSPNHTSGSEQERLPLIQDVLARPIGDDRHSSLSTDRSAGRRLEPPRGILAAPPSLRSLSSAAAGG
eukprot:TRINITY_DN26926_c1_g1_i1.p1 TRINITY_DN26926_c1_g1~~TRINITY_DN26926_c1_g1_i1.p1  ORF type:complete len:100 (-),score=13.20 TRINITY_DN26926_c1_g1_i1:87-386(-)